MEGPYVSKIRIYPIKSLDPVEIDKVEMGYHSLKHDRAFAMVAKDNRYINGKRTGRVNQLKATYDLSEQLISLSPRNGGKTETFELRADNELLLNYLEDFFGMEMILLHSLKGRLLDIPKASSVTIVSQASLESLHADLGDRSLEDLRLRFRTNIELSGVEAFWEENLFGSPGTGIKFRIGEVEMVGVNPRARCNVPPKDPYTGETDKQFVKAMMDSRARSLPADSVLSEHGSLYQLTVNTFLPEDQQGKHIRLGDPLEIIGPVSLS